MNDSLHDIAARHGFSDDAAIAAQDALRRGGGMAQFNHPELGGYGQWMNGMVMLGRMGDFALQGRVAALFADLAQLQSEPGGSAAGSAISTSGRAEAPAAEPLGSVAFARNTMEPMKPMAPIHGVDAPADWGQPASSGGQNGVRYAYFGRARRLVVERDGRRTVYDTADHDIGGVSQDQSDLQAGRLVFTSQNGSISLDSLKIVDR